MGPPAPHDCLASRVDPIIDAQCSTGSLPALEQEKEQTPPRWQVAKPVRGTERSFTRGEISRLYRRVQKAQQADGRQAKVSE